MPKLTGEQNSDIKILVGRHERVAYGNVGSEDKFFRMKGFTAADTKSETKTYDRKYIDEKTVRTDTTGVSSSIGYELDLYSDNYILEKIERVHHDELIGSDADITIVVVDFYRPIEGKANTYQARKRKFTIVPDTAGGEDAYTLKGEFKSKSELIKGEAVVAQDGLSCTFTPEKPLSV